MRLEDSLLHWNQKRNSSFDPYTINFLLGHAWISMHYSVAVE